MEENFFFGRGGEGTDGLKKKRKKGWDDTRATAETVSQSYDRGGREKINVCFLHRPRSPPFFWEKGGGEEEDAISRGK